MAIAFITFLASLLPSWHQELQRLKRFVQLDHPVSKPLHVLFLLPRNVPLQPLCIRAPPAHASRLSPAGLPCFSESLRTGYFFLWVPPEGLMPYVAGPLCWLPCALSHQSRGLALSLCAPRVSLPRFTSPEASECLDQAPCLSSPRR